jgi:uncharacterized protein (TIGR03067 family)
MKLHFPALVAAGLLVAFGFANADEAKQQAEKFAGTWGAVSYVQDGQGEGEKIAPQESPVRWVFKGDKVTFLADVEAASAKGSFKLDPSKKPKAIDIVFPAAPGDKKGQTVLGIYELDGDTLKLCYDPDGAKRPAEFKSMAGSKLILVVFKKLNEHS